MTISAFRADISYGSTVRAVAAFPYSEGVVVPFSNNMSEKNLMICKNRKKMAEDFRNDKGKQTYCDIMSFVETVKRKKANIFQSIAPLSKILQAIQRLVPWLCFYSEGI